MPILVGTSWLGHSMEVNAMKCNVLNSNNFSSFALEVEFFSNRTIFIQFKGRNSFQAAKLNAYIKRGKARSLNFHSVIPGSL